MKGKLVSKPEVILDFFTLITTICLSLKRILLDHFELHLKCPQKRRLLKRRTRSFVLRNESTRVVGLSVLWALWPIVFIRILF